MAGRRVLDVIDYIGPESLACIISAEFDRFWMGRTKKEADWSEVSKYVYATDTTTTANASLPWKNKTTRPKICQIRDNLHANYMAALFPTEDWFEWEPLDKQAVDPDKVTAVKAYMKSKLKQSDFEETVSRYIYDLIDYGNVFGDVEWVNETFKDSTGKEVTQYIGPRATRYSPYDVYFDITSPTFEQSPKIIKTLLSLGTIHKLMKIDPNWMKVDPKIIAKVEENRRYITTAKGLEIRKSEALVAAGFSDLSHYYGSGLVEVLEFEGDIYNLDTGEFIEQHIITVIDRAYVIRKEPIKTWTGKSTKQHCGWRLRSDNLMAMGPLDNLVGMQYRIDHLENLKADVFDLIAYPVAKVRGYVEDFTYGPMERIYMDVDADVEFMRPETTALNADLQIRELEEQMEEMAGAPRTAMGIRTPGEKTKFEVQTLDNAAGRMFQNKISYFEKQFLEKLLNGMLEAARRNIDSVDLVRVFDTDLGITKFLEITKQDLEAKGKLVPMGARHFSAQAQLIQNLTNLSGTGLYQDPAVSVHMSGLRIAKLLEENMGLSKYRIVESNIRIIENAESQNLAASAADQTQANAMTPPMTPEDIPDDLGAGPEEEEEVRGVE